MIKRKIIFITLSLLIISGLFTAFYFFTQKPKTTEQTTQGESSEIQKLAQTINTDPKYQDKNSNEYKEARSKFCELIARSTQEQTRAIGAIKSFLENPNADVKYLCAQFKRADYDDTPETERYSSEGREFVIDIQSNRITEVEPPQGNWIPSKNATKTYTQAELEKQATDFIVNHSQALGTIDLEKFTLTTDTKNNETYLFRWLLNGCRFGDPECKTIELVYSNTGEIIRYASSLE